MCTRTAHVPHSSHLKSSTNKCSQPANGHLQGSTLVTCQQLASPVMASPRQQHVTPAEPDRTGPARQVQTFIFWWSRLNIQT